eukprot:1228474-Pyramimonas_sp.AAC.1
MSQHHLAPGGRGGKLHLATTIAPARHTARVGIRGRQHEAWDEAQGEGHHTVVRWERHCHGHTTYREERHRRTERQDKDAGIEEHKLYELAAAHEQLPAETQNPPETNRCQNVSPPPPSAQQNVSMQCQLSAAPGQLGGKKPAAPERPCENAAMETAMDRCCASERDEQN